MGMWTIPTSRISSGDEEKPSAEGELGLFIGELADGIVKRKLGIPAVFFFEALTPLAFVSASVLGMAAPFLEYAVTPDKLDKLEMLLEDKAAIEVLIRKIETLEKQSK